MGSSAMRKGSRAAMREEGRALRRRVPRTSHASWDPAMRSLDPIATLLATGRNRLPDLLPLRYGRMSRSAFAWMRGSAALMASDLSATPVTGLRVQACGDCHVGNFGAFASPERRVLFDLTDFDETLPGPWEFDLKRLTTSLTLVARHQGCSARETREVTLAAARAYRRHMHDYGALSPLEVWYAIIDSEVLIRTAPDAATRRRRIRFERKARGRTGNSLLGRLLVASGGRLRFREQPPTIVPLPPRSRLAQQFGKVLERYPESLAKDRRQLLARYRFQEIAFKVVGVGSVGTRCAVALYLSPGGEPLVLQVKEAVPSVLAPYAGRSPFAHEGERVVVGQRLMQCASDIFLGWASDDDGRDYYVRQLRDMKTSVPLEMLQGPVLHNFADMCGWALARAHAKAGDAARIAGYLGASDKMDRAIADFAAHYADQCERDYAVFRRAIRVGTVKVRLERP
jgi:uncharacterized protein (DUF2252 family)